MGNSNNWCYGDTMGFWGFFFCLFTTQKSNSFLKAQKKINQKANLKKTKPKQKTKQTNNNIN